MTLRLGVIGSSYGNGHPYSWSAIFNGYDINAMQACGYPVIPEYLGRQKWPDSKIDGAKVTTVWTQDRELSNHIAQSAYIEHVSSNLEELKGRVDAVLLARDDAENHFEHAAPFLAAGMPIYIDKPVAHSLPMFDRLYDLEQYSGQIFTCSALRYSEELLLTKERLRSIGSIREIVGVTPKSWEKYAVHIIEPILKMLSIEDVPISFKTEELDSSSASKRCLSVVWESGIKTIFQALGDVNSSISITVNGSESSQTLVFSDSFAVFRIALEQFVDGVREKSINSPKAFNKKVVTLIAAGMA